MDDGVRTLGRRLAWALVLVCATVSAGAAEEPSAAPTSAESAAAPPGATGTLTGVITVRATGKPLAGVKITAGGLSTTTDAAGRFTLELPPGRYDFRLASLAYQSVVIEGVEVAAGQVTVTNAALNPAVVSRSSANLDVVEVYGEVTRASESTQIARRLEAGAVSETVSAETLRKLPGGDVASVAKRVPSVTVVETPDGEKILCVRGLCNRYTLGLVDGALLPSTNPVRRLVPAELFPPEFLDSLVVYKSFLPDLRGNGAGAQVEFELREPPEVLTYSLSAGVGGNTQTTFQEFNDYEGSSGDWLTLGAGDRALPVPDTPLDDLPDEQRWAVGRSFRDVWDVEQTTAPPDFGAKFSVGNTVGRFGFLLAGLYKNEWRARSEDTRTLLNEGTPDDPDVAVRDAFPDTERDFFTSRLAGFLNTRLHLPDDHRIDLTSFVSRRAQDETVVQVASPENGGQVINLNEGGTQVQSRLKYIEDEVAFAQLRGTHPFPWYEVKWRTALSRSTRCEPDTRHTTYQAEAGDPLRFTTDSLGGVVISNTTLERLSDSGADVTVPFDTRLPFTTVWSGLPAKLRGGWNYTYRERSFAQRRFSFIPNPATQDTTQSPEVLFGPGQIGLGVADVVEQTLPTDAFDATESILAYYGMLELPIVRDRLRVVGGVRVEDATLRLDTTVFNDGSLCAPGETLCDVTIERAETDPLPGASLIFSPREDMNLRFGWGKTISRPEFRELAPTEFPAQRGERSQFGNTALVQSTWTGYDVRFEWLPSPVDVLSLGAFWKEGENPIEKVELTQASDPAETWVNADKSEILGFEFEARKDFGALHPRLLGLSLQTNVTYFPIKETTVPVADVNGLQTQQTNTTRDAVDIPNFIVNAGLEYSVPETMAARLLYTTVGPTLLRAGALGVPDAVLQRSDVLDVVLQFPLDRWLKQPLTLQFVAENVLNDQIVETQGNFVTRTYTRGVSFGLSLTYSR
jgi:hypothetical protein